MLTSLGVIGRGGFGTVDLVQNTAGEKFARKTFAQNQPLSPELVENVLKRFKKEVRTQGNIDHRNIVRIVHSDLDAAPPYYLMPVAVTSLDRDIAADRTLSGNFLSAFSDIVAGLEVLHSMHIYHRDLKPQNVLRFNDVHPGNDFYAISDFGLISLQESQLTMLTTTGMALGADRYTAPEVTQDLRYSSIQSDIYSLGCILHDFVGLGHRVPCHEIRENSAYGAILSGCTRQNPAQRFKSARSVLDAVLSIGALGAAPTSAQSADFVALLDADPSTVVPSKWRELADFLYDVATSDEARAIYMRISEERIAFLCANHPADAKSIGVSFANWVGRSAFNFDYCDGLANRLEAFFSYNDYELQAACLMALLAMGTSHNRWYVEHKFIRLTGHAMNDALAARLAIEFRILDNPVCHQVRHLESSIGLSRALLHPRLQQALAGVCG